MRPAFLDLLAVALFALALVHTFSTRFFLRLAHRHPRHAGLFHLLGETEVVFGLWAGVLAAAMAAVQGKAAALGYLESRQYTEPLFVFAVMVIAASRPVQATAASLVAAAARALPMRDTVAQVWLALWAVPLMGSFITEPAAMTLAALMLRGTLFREGPPEWTKYAALGVLFVNVSIGGVLTAYAAPPVLMVAGRWNWDSAFMATHFGWKAALAVLANASLLVALLRPHLPASADEETPAGRVPGFVQLVHLGFLAGVVVFAHHPVVFLALLLFFMGFTHAYPRHQDPLVLREALLVAFFLAGLVVLGGLQRWWLQPIVSSLSPGALFAASVALTAVTDNAALTYLGSLIDGIGEPSKYMLVAGAVAGGGLTVIANAPNPAGAALLRGGFADGSIGAGRLLLGAAGPTVVAVLAFLLL